VCGSWLVSFPPLLNLTKIFWFSFSMRFDSSYFVFWIDFVFFLILSCKLFFDSRSTMQDSAPF
jgi:hypothetical protein